MNREFSTIRCVADSQCLVVTQRLIVMLSSLLLLGCLSDLALSQSIPLYKQQPFDQIRLTQANGGKVLQVLPIDLPGRRVPADPDPDGKILVRLLDQPANEYSLAWKDIERLTLFEQNVLRAAEVSVRKRDFDQAYWHYAFLLKEYPQLRGLKNSVESFWIAEASHAFRQKTTR